MCRDVACNVSTKLSVGRLFYLNRITPGSILSEPQYLSSKGGELCQKLKFSLNPVFT